MALDGIIFDLDGTLIDSNRLHTRAWSIALEKFGYRLGEDRIALEIGKGGSMLVPALVGREAEERRGDDLRSLHGEEYRRLIRDGVRTYPGVEELFRACHERGLRIAVATASKQENLEKVTAAAGLDLDALADEVVTDTDVERSKPHADVVVAAYQKLGLGPGQCVMVGDTPYDVRAAAGAGVACVGVLTGVHGAETMRMTGARAVYRDAAELFSQLDEALAAAAPGPGRLTNDLLEALMDEAIAAARGSRASSGAVLARSDGSVLHRTHATTTDGPPLAHAALDVLTSASVDQITHDDLVLVSTHALCPMCLGAAVEARVETVVHAIDGEEQTFEVNAGTRRHPRRIRGIGSDRAAALSKSAVLSSRH